MEVLASAAAADSDTAAEDDDRDDTQEDAHHADDDDDTVDMDNHPAAAAGDAHTCDVVAHEHAAQGPCYNSSYHHLD